MNLRIRSMAGAGLLTLLALAACGSSNPPPNGTAEAGPALPIARAGPDGAVPTPRPPSEAAVQAVETAGLLPPRAQAMPGAPVEGAIAFAFRAPGTPGATAGWYRGMAPGRAFRLESELQEGGEHVLSGTTRRPAGDFSVRLAADPGGGTTGMVLVTPRR